MILRGSGDTVLVENLSDAFQVKVVGKTVFLNSDTQTIQLNLAKPTSTSTTTTTSVEFLDGSASIVGTYASGKVTWKMGGLALTNKYADFVPTTALGTATNAETAFDDASTTTTTTTGTTYTLTTGVDNKVGGSGDDTFDGSLSGANITFGASDTIDGGAGTDTLIIATNAAATYTAGSISNIEKIAVTSSVGAGVYALAGVTGLTNVSSSGSTNTVEFTNLASLSTGLEVKNTAQNATFGFAAATVAGTSDSASLTVSNVTGGAISVAGVETLNIASTGGSNTVATMTTAAATKFVVTGSQNLTVTNDLGNTVATVDASAFTGSLDVDMGVGAVTVTGGSGNDTFDFEVTGAVSATGGAGNDTFIFDGTGTITSADTVAGGDGTDTIESTATEAEAITTALTVATSIEVVKLTGAGTAAAQLDAADFGSGVTKVSLGAGTGDGTYTINFNAGTSELDLIGAIGAGLNANVALDAAGSATTDALTINYKDTTADIAEDLVVTDFETLTLTNTGGTADTIGSVTMTASAGGTATLKFTGNKGFTTSGADTFTAAVIDASGLTGGGAVALVMAAAAASGATSIIGSAGNDTLLGDGSGSISGDAGNDSITGGANNDTLTGGDGNDTLTSGAGNDSITAGAGNDTITLAGDLATGDTFDGGDGTDTLRVTNASLDAIDGYSFSVAGNLNTAMSNIEKLRVTDAFNLGVAFDMSRLDSLTDITLAGGTTGAEELNGLSANTTITVGDDSTLTATLSDSTGSSDAITFALVDLDGTPSAETVTLLSTSGIETVNVTLAEDTADAANIRVYTVTTLTATSSTAVNISGTESLTVTNATALKKVDASGMSAGILTLSVANAAVGATVTGGAGADVITGSANSDTIAGGSGADSINGGALNDTIDGGAGADTALYGGTDIDSITGGEAADSIAGGAGNDAIILTESIAAIDSVYIGSTDTASTDVAIGATNIDTVTGFTAGATSGDILVFDVGTVVVTNTTQKVATLSADGVTLTSLANTAAAGDVDVLIVLGEYGSYAAVQTTLNSTAGAITDATNGAIVVWKDGSGNTQVYYDTNISAGGGTGTQMVVLSGVNTASLTADNFDVIA